MITVHLPKPFSPAIQFSSQNWIAVAGSAFGNNPLTVTIEKSEEVYQLSVAQKKAAACTDCLFSPPPPASRSMTFINQTDTAFAVYTAGHPSSAYQTGPWPIDPHTEMPLILRPFVCRRIQILLTLPQP
jgi:hypothetical protein